MHEPTLLVHFKKGIEIYGNIRQPQSTSIAHFNVAPLQKRAKARLVQSLAPGCVQYGEELLHLTLLAIERVLPMISVALTGT